MNSAHQAVAKQQWQWQNPYFVPDNFFDNMGLNWHFPINVFFGSINHDIWDTGCCLYAIKCSSVRKKHPDAVQLLYVFSEFQEKWLKPLPFLRDQTTKEYVMLCLGLGQRIASLHEEGKPEKPYKIILTQKWKMIDRCTLYQQVNDNCEMIIYQFFTILSNS